MANRKISIAHLINLASATLITGGLFLCVAIAASAGVDPEVSRYTSAPQESLSDLDRPSGFYWQGKQLSNAEYRAHSLTNASVTQIQHGNWIEAERMLREAIQLDPDLPTARVNLGLTLSALGKHDEAIVEIGYAAGIDRREPAILISLGSAYVAGGHLAEASKTYKDYLMRFPNGPDAARAAELAQKIDTELKNQRPGGATTGDDYLSSAPSHYYTTWLTKEIRVHLDPALDVHGYRSEFTQVLCEAFATWEAADVVRFKFVDNKAQADIECIWTHDPSRLSSIAEGGEAKLSYKGGRLAHCQIVLLTERAPGANPPSVVEIKALCLHEIGHALGLIGHSPNSDDIMYCAIRGGASQPHLSKRDIGTLRKLYARS